MSEANSNSNSSSSDSSSDANSPNALKDIKEKGLQKMEALLRQSAMGIHILFDNDTIAKSLKRKPRDDRELLDFEKMKRIQEIMTELITKGTYYEKVDYLQELDEDSFDMLVRTYIHIVENNVRQASEHTH